MHLVPRQGTTEAMKMDIDSASNIADGIVAIKSRSQIPDEELKAVMDVSSKWPYHGHRDGWFRAHEAIRADMRDINEALNRTVIQLEGGEPLADWQTKNIKIYWPKFVGKVHHHHDNEELIAFPFISTRVTLPPKMSADHKTLMTLMDECTLMVAHLAPGRRASVDLAAWSELSNKFGAFHNEMLEHLREEDEIGLPMLRKYFSMKEFKPVEKKIVAGMKPEDCAWFLRPFASEADKRAWMTEVAKIPGLVQALIILPACRKWQKNHVRLLEELIFGQQITPPSTGCFGH